MFKLNENERIIIENGIRINTIYSRKIFNNNYACFLNTIKATSQNTDKNNDNLIPNVCNYPIECKSEALEKYFCKRHSLYAIIKNLKININQEVSNYNLNLDSISCNKSGESIKTELEAEDIIKEYSKKLNVSDIERIFTREFINELYKIEFDYSKCIHLIPKEKELKVNVCNIPKEFTITKKECKQYCKGQYFCNNVQHKDFAFKYKLPIYTLPTDNKDNDIQNKSPRKKRKVNKNKKETSISSGVKESTSKVSNVCCSYEYMNCKNEGKHQDYQYPNMFYCDTHVLLTSETEDSIKELDKEIKELSIKKDYNTLKTRCIKRYKISTRMNCGIPQYQVEILKNTIN